MASKVIENNYVAYNNWGNFLARQGKGKQAIVHFSKALQVNPDFAGAYDNPGVILARKGRLDETIVHFTKALRLKPGFLQAQNNLAIALHEAQKLDETRKYNKTP
jgi:Flp pilus assembly protein TadD